MEWINWAQGLPPLVKLFVTGAVLLIAVAGLAVFWRDPPAQPKLDSAKHSSEQQAQSTNVGANAGVNNGIIAGTYNAPSSQKEELAREQLADLREGRVQSKLAADKAAKQAKKDTEDRKRTTESEKVAQLIDRLRVEYIHNNDGLSSALLAGTEAVPDAWMNERLRQLGMPYTYHGNANGSFTFTPDTSRAAR